MSQQSTHGKGQQDAHAAGQQRSGALAIKLLVIELHSDQEEEEHQADGGKSFEWSERIDGKESG
jgi:hypothetical protein